MDGYWLINNGAFWQKSSPNKCLRKWDVYPLVSSDALRRGKCFCDLTSPAFDTIQIAPLWSCAGCSRAPENTFKTFASPPGESMCKGCARSQSSDKSGSAIQTLLIVWCNMDDGEFKILNYFLKAFHSRSWVNKRSGNKFIALVDEKLLSNCREKRENERHRVQLFDIMPVRLDLIMLLFTTLQRFWTFEPFKALYWQSVNNARWIQSKIASM